MTHHEYLTYGARMTAKRGTDLPHARLNPAAVREIRENTKGLTAKQWAAKYGVHQRTIDKVRDYRSWVHV